MSSRDKIASIRQPVLPVKMLLLLVFCLTGLSAHFLADNFEHFLWQPVIETSSLQAEHDDHQEQNESSIRPMPSANIVFMQCLPLQDCPYQFFPPLSPLLHPPKPS
jgi:hypothetical protein